jgi:uncharacterized protein with HEPN domain
MPFSGISPRSAMLPDSFQLRSMTSSPGVPWQQPIRLRNRIVHGYWSIDLEVLHTTATEQPPAFAADLRHVLGSITESA